MTIVKIFNFIMTVEMKNSTISHLMFYNNLDLTAISAWILYKEITGVNIS